MKVPGFLFGTHREVKAACRRKVTQLKRGATWAELPDVLVETREYPCLLIINGPLEAGGPREHFSFWTLARVLFNEIGERLPEDSYRTMFEPIAATNWGFLAMLSRWGNLFVHPPDQQQRLLHHAVHWWDMLAAEGARYSDGRRQGRTLWEVFSNLQMCLARQGLPKELLHQPLAEGGMAELVAQTAGGLPPTRQDMH